MAQYKVTGVIEIRSDFIVDAVDAYDAIRKAKQHHNNQFVSTPRYSSEEHFIAEEIKEENTNE